MEIFHLLDNSLSIVIPRLRLLDRSLVPKQVVEGMLERGRQAPPEALPIEARAAAIRNPALATAYAAGGALRSIDTGDQKRADWSAVALAMALASWGYLAEAEALASHAYRANRFRENSLFGFYAEWQRTMVIRRLTPTPTDDTRLLTISQFLGSLLGQDSPQSRLCLLDAILDRCFKADDPLPELDELIDYFIRTPSQEAELGLCYVLKAYHTIVQAELDHAHNYLAKAQNLTLSDAPYVTLFLHQCQAEIYTIRQDHTQAITSLQHALDIAVSLQHANARSGILTNLARVSLNADDLHGALNYADAAVDFGVETGNLIYQGDAYRIRGHIHMERASYQKARKDYDRAHDAFANYGNLGMLAEVQMGIGRYSHRRGQFNAAIEYLFSAVNVAESSGNPMTRLDAYYYYGLACLTIHDFDTAVESLQRALDIARTIDAPAQQIAPQIELAYALVKQGKLEEAGPHLSKTLHLADEREQPHAQARTHLVFSELEKSRGVDNLPEAEWFCENALTVAQNSNLVGLCHKAELELMLIRHQMGKLKPDDDLLNAEYRKKLPECLRWKQSYLTALVAEQYQTGDVLERYQQALEDLRHLRSSFSSEEQAGTFAGALDEVYLRAYRAAVAQGTEQAFEMALKYTEMHSAQVASSYYADILDYREVTVDSIRQKLGEEHGADWTVLRYTLVGEHFAAFILTPDELHHVELPLTTSELAFRLRPLARQTGHSAMRGLWDGTAYGLENDRRDFFNELIPEVVLDRLHPGHLLIVVRSAGLNRVSFQTFTNPETDRYLIEMASLVYARSLPLLCVSLRRPKSVMTGQALMLGQSEFNEFRYKQLEFVPREAEMLRELTGITFKIVLNEDEEANRIMEDVLAGEWPYLDVLHLSTHTYTEDGIVRGVLLGGRHYSLMEIREGQFGIELVVAPNCISGISEYFDGDEVTGLAQAFLNRGVRSVLAAHWPVSDSAVTVSILRTFYRHYLTGETPAGALAHAQREAIAEGIEARHWANFFLLGSP